jgi:hypothetical protein
MKTYREPMSISSSYHGAMTHESLWTRFINWCAAQEEKRMFWLAIGVAGHGCVITVLTVLAIVTSGNLTYLWPFVIAAMTSCLVVNLAALPTKITIPVSFFSVLIDVVIIGICISNGINLNSIFA